MRLPTKKDMADNSNGTVKSVKHYHTLERMKSKTKRKDIYRCIHPDCNFYGPRHLLEGKYAICKLCSTQYTVTKNALSLKTPHCGCRNNLGFEQQSLHLIGKTEDEQASTAMQILEPLLPKRQTSD
jgi:hypothetical protein